MQRDDDPATKRILARRARDAERTKKLHNSRLRNVGADIAGIKAQIQAKQEVKRAQQEDDRSYMNNQEAVRRYLTSVEQEAWQLQHTEAIALRADWSTQSSTRGDRIEADLAIPVTQIPATHAETCSLGAAQLFDGEDTMKKERLRLQALQLRKWTEAQKMEKSAKSAQAKQEDMAFAATLLNNDIINIVWKRTNLELKYTSRPWMKQSRRRWPLNVSKRKNVKPSRKHCHEEALIKDSLMDLEPLIVNTLYNITFLYPNVFLLAFFVRQGH